jgi:hypothetical protein
MDTKTTTSKKRVQPVRRKVRQLDWLMAWMVRTHNCAFCGVALVEGYDSRNPGQSITLHHTEGSREEDRWDDPEYVAKMVPAHKSCHRAFHLLERHNAEGKNVDRAKLASFNKNLGRCLNKQGVKQGVK